nr:hypothetical protein [uncultured Acidocella sp.]
MHEIRNDLIETDIQRKIMAGRLVTLLEVAVFNLKEAENVERKLQKHCRQGRSGRD